jgi:hypothetical protein
MDIKEKMMRFRRLQERVKKLQDRFPFEASVFNVIIDDFGDIDAEFDSLFQILFEEDDEKYYENKYRGAGK